MAVSNITPTQIEAAAFMDNLDAAVLFIQNKAGIEDGGVAGITIQRRKWAKASDEERVEILKGWLAMEMHYEREDA